MILFDYILGRFRKQDEAGGGGGDMTKAVYDIGDTGVVDNAQALQGFSSAYHLNRANHVGTQLSNTISDFDSRVAGNTSVVANTAKVSADGSVTSHSDVTNAGSGAIITTAERNKLNAITGTNTGDEVQATESIAGIAEIATEAEVDAETDNQRFITPLRLAQRLLKRIIYGNNRMYWEEEGVQSTTSTVYQTAMAETTTPLDPTHTYRFSFYCETSGGTNNNRRVELFIALGTETICNSQVESAQGETWQDRSGFRELTGLSGAQPVLVQYRRQGGGGSASISFLRVSIIRVA